MEECQEDCLSAGVNQPAGGKERDEIVQQVVAQMASVVNGPVDSLSNRRTVGREKEKNTVPTTVMIRESRKKGGRADKNRKRKYQYDRKNQNSNPCHPRHRADEHV